MHFTGLSHSGSGSWVLHKSTNLVGPMFCALPRPKQLRRPGAWRAHSPSWAVCLITSPVPGAWFPECTMRAPSQMCHVSPLGSWSLLPSWWKSTVQDPRKTWLVTGSLLTVWWRMLSLGPRLPLAFWLWLLPACLSGGGRGWSTAWLALLWCSLNPLLYEWARLCLRAFLGKVLFFSLSLWLPTVWVAVSR